MLEDFEVPHTIQRHRVFEPQWYRWFGAQVRWAVNGNRNDDGWNVNRNSVDNPNPWNAGRLLVSRNSFLPPALNAREFSFGDLSSIRRPFCRFPANLPRASHIFCYREDAIHMLSAKEISTCRCR